MNEKLWIDDHPIVTALCYIGLAFTMLVNGVYLAAMLGVI